MISLLRNAIVSDIKKPQELKEKKIELYRKFQEVILSCKNEEQLKNAYNWAERVFIIHIVNESDPILTEKLLLELALFFKSCSVKLLNKEVTC